MDINELEPLELVSMLLGAIVVSMGGIVELDLPAIQQFAENQEQNAVRLDVHDDKITLEIVNEDSLNQQTSEGSDES